jgi:hypothetical protein
VLGNRIEQRNGLQAITQLTGSFTDPAGVDSVLDAGHDQLYAGVSDRFVAKCDHLVEVVAGVDVHDRESHLRRPERLTRQVQHHDRVLAAGEQQHRTFELAGDFTQDVHRLVLEVAEPPLVGGAWCVDDSHSRFSPTSSASSSATASSIDLFAVSRRNSGVSGASYSPSTPVRPSIFPDRCRA